MRSQLKWVSLLKILLGLMTAANAQTGPLSLEDCIKLAMAAASPAGIAEQEIAISDQEQVIARSAFLPHLSFNNGFIYNSPLPGLADQMSFVAANGIREYVSTVDSTFEIDLSGRLRAGLALARARRNLADAQLRLTRRDLRRAVSVAYYDVLMARKLVELRQSGLAEAESFESKTRARQLQGEASMADVHKAAAQRSRFQQRLSQARLNARLANQVLASFWTSDGDRQLELVYTLEPLPPLPPEITPTSSTAIDKAVRRRPEFDRLEALQSGFKAERSRARASLRPQIDLVFQYGLNSNSVQVADRGYTAFAYLRFPFFDGARSRAAARQALYRQSQTSQEEEIAQRALTREYLAARAKVESWYERVPLSRQEMEDAGENLRLARLLYESGEGLALDVVTAQTQMIEASAAYFGALAAYRRSLVDFAVASGQ